jgi:hypothetical protein
MIPVKIISKVEIPSINQEVIADLIKREILANHPELTITDVTFERKLNPQRIEATVEAQLGGVTSEKIMEPENRIDQTVAKAEVVEKTLIEEAIDTPEITAGNSIADLFNTPTT